MVSVWPENHFSAKPTLRSAHRVDISLDRFGCWLVVVWSEATTSVRMEIMPLGPRTKDLPGLGTLAADDCG